MICNVCYQHIKLSKVREHVHGHCLRDDDFHRVYRRVTGVVTVPGHFRVSGERLKEIAKRGSELLENATPEDLEDWSEFTEWTDD